MNQKIFHTPPPPNKGLGSVNRLTFIINTPLQYITQQINHFFAEGVGAMDTELHLPLGHIFGTLILCKIRI